MFAASFALKRGEFYFNGQIAYFFLVFLAILPSCIFPEMCYTIIVPREWPSTEELWREANISPASTKECVLVTLDDEVVPADKSIPKGNGY